MLREKTSAAQLEVAKLRGKVVQDVLKKCDDRGAMEDLVRRLELEAVLTRALNGKSSQVKSRQVLQGAHARPHTGTRPGLT